MEKLRIVQIGHNKRLIILSEVIISDAYYSWNVKQIGS